MAGKWFILKVNPFLVLRAAVARGGTEPAQNPTWQPGGATLHFLELICGPELALKLLQVRISFAE